MPLIPSGSKLEFLKKLNNVMDKRTFIKNIIRGFILVGIGAVFGKSLFKKKPSEPCNYVYLCKGCNKISDCQLDEAIKFRREKK